MRISKFISKFILFTLILVTYNSSLLSSENLKNSQNSLEDEIFAEDAYLENYIEENEYILGPGDLLQISVSRMYPELLSEALISRDGTIFLPKLNKIHVNGLTLTELISILNKKYLEFVKYPSVEITINSYRPIKVVINGEVNSPGLQTLDGSLGKEQNKIYFPTLYDAIREAGGITRGADLSNIQIIRKNKTSNGGGLISTNLDFYKFINGDSGFNLRIFDGDTITLAKVDNPDKLLSQKNMKLNLTPQVMDVYVSGRVNRSGLLTLPTSSSLNEAIMIANGKKVITGPLTFLRFNDDGTYIKKKFKYSSRAKPGSSNNPYLRQRDIVFVGQNLFTNTSQLIREIASPFSGIVSTYGLYKAIID